MKKFPKKLLNGYQNFMVNRFAFEKKRHETLAQHGQKPETMVIACCDSRATPENIFDTNPGEIFVMRNIANLVPPFNPNGVYSATSSAIEYAVQKLKVRHIVILGHALCGGIQATLNFEDKPLSDDDFIGQWMQLIYPTAQKLLENKTLSPEDLQKELEQNSIRTSLKNLRSFPFVKEKEQNGEIALYGAWFGIANGELWLLDEEENSFYKAEYNLNEPFCNINRYNL